MIHDMKYHVYQDQYLFTCFIFILVKLQIDYPQISNKNYVLRCGVIRKRLFLVSGDYSDLNFNEGCLRPGAYQRKGGILKNINLFGSIFNRYA